ncbi:alkaline phosphatase family protein [Sphingomonas sp. GlSt437]|uniref:alkaline phosphatase family protein n=1 Tax=Sphingomonas sp. GlSt437 TaxID=3389970 RepID=UPI003A898907
MMRAFGAALLAGFAILLPVRSSPQTPPQRHNLIIFVADGLRSRIVSDKTAPTMAAIRRDGVDFADSHSVYPTLTTANASAFATGHQLGDTGDFANTIYPGFRVTAQHGSPTPFLENDGVLAELNEHFVGNYLNETSILTAAADAGYATAAVGKLGPVAIQANPQRDGARTIVIDDATGHDGGLPIPDAIAAAIVAAGLPATAPGRGDNGKSGDFRTPGTRMANLDQIGWFTKVATDVVLPRFQKAGVPFAMVFWSRDPDGTQHNQGDSLNRLEPGINGATSMAAIRNADGALAALQGALKRLGLDRTTDIIVVADHGFSTISRDGVGSDAAKARYGDVVPGMLPPGFLGLDLGQAIGLRMIDADTGRPVDPAKGIHPLAGNLLLGGTADAPAAVIAANGGTDLIYLTGNDRQALALRMVTALETRPYVSSIFVADDLGAIPGTLPLSRINLDGGARTPRPDIVVGFTTKSTGCANAELCATEIADTTLQQGQGMHGSFSRADTHNFMAAIGPDFKAGFRDPMPAGNADVGMTAARLLHLILPAKGQLVGRVLDEALRGGMAAPVEYGRIAAVPADNGFRTILDFERVGSVTYLDAAGMPGRTVGLAPEKARR